MRTSTRPTYSLAFALALAALALSALFAPAAGLARSGTAGRPAVTPATGAAPPATCLVHSLPSFVAQGEFAVAATVADVIEVECNPYVYGTGAPVTITAAQLSSRCQELTWYVPNESAGNGGDGTVTPDAGFVWKSGPSVTLHLDVDGNATVALIAGPHCMAGESLVTLDEDESPYETFTTAFQVLPAGPTPPGLYATPSSQVEDAASSAVATIVEAEFTGAPEAKVRLGAGQLYNRCQRGEHLIWVRENRELVVGPELADEHAVELDNDGNGFALAIGSDSCAEGVSLIEGDLEQSPFTTLTTEFTVLPPQPTEEPSFTIVKSQEIAGTSAGFTTSPLTGKIGETVDYEIVVTNTSHVKETFSAFSDPNCDSIAGGPGPASVLPGESATYTCSHELTTLGTYTNEATVTGNTVGGRPLTQTSNRVVVNVVPKSAILEPGYTIEKRQRIGSTTSFTTATVTGPVGSTVEYEIIVKNTGNVPLSVSGFADANCDPGTIAGGPGTAELGRGQETTYTCTRLLASVGTFDNVAAVTATPPGDGSLPTMSSNMVQAITTSPAHGEGPNTGELPHGVKESCESSRPVLHGGSGPQTGTFTVWVRSNGIARVTFYLDGRRLHGFTQSQARHGRFKLTLNARGLRYGIHHVAIQVQMANKNCASTASAHMFVRPRPVTFTG